MPALDRLVAQKLPPDAAARYLKSTQATQSQSDVLGKLMETVNEKGETVDDRAAYVRMQNKAGGIAAGAQSGIQRQMASRGLAGSGMSYALQQQGAQDAVNRANESGLQEASDARRRYSESLAAAGNLSTGMRGQELAAMRAQDEINMFNARQQSDADRYNGGLAQQDFDNVMAKESATANARNGVANDYTSAAQATRQTAAGVGNAALTVGAAYDQYGNPVDPKKKPDYASSAGAK